MLKGIIVGKQTPLCVMALPTRQIGVMALSERYDTGCILAIGIFGNLDQSTVEGDPCLNNLLDIPFYMEV